MEGVLGLLDPKFNILFYMIINIIINQIENTMREVRTIGYTKWISRTWTKTYIGIPLLLSGFVINKLIQRKDKDIGEPFKNVKLHFASAFLAFTILGSQVFFAFGVQNDIFLVNYVLYNLRMITYLVYSYISPNKKPNKRELVGILLSLFCRISKGISYGIIKGFNPIIFGGRMVKCCIYYGSSHIGKALTVVLIDYIIHNIPVSGGVQMGFQSIYSILLSVLIFIPMNYHGLIGANDDDGIHEDLYKSFLMAKSNITIILYLILFIIMVFFSSLFKSVTIQCFNGFYIILAEGLVPIFLTFLNTLFSFQWKFGFGDILMGIFSIGYTVGCLIYANILPIFNDETKYAHQILN